MIEILSAFLTGCGITFIFCLISVRGKCFADHLTVTISREDYDFLNKKIPSSADKIYKGYSSQESLPSAIRKVLINNMGGMSACDISSKLISLGYESHSKNFEKNVYSNLYTMKRQGIVNKNGKIWSLTE